jgi:hypothetical protein
VNIEPYNEFKVPLSWYTLKNSKINVYLLIDEEKSLSEGPVVQETPVLPKYLQGEGEPVHQ